MRRVFEKLIHWLRGRLFEACNVASSSGANAHGSAIPNDRKGSADASGPGPEVVQGHGSYAYSEIGDARVSGGKILRSRSVYRQVPGGIVEAQSHAMLRTPTGKIIDPAAIKALCVLCGSYDDELILCGHCQHAICGGCRKTLRKPSGDMPLCHQAFVVYQEYLDLWNEADAKADPDQVVTELKAKIPSFSCGGRNV